jgi:hypothetical protein
LGTIINSTMIRKFFALIFIAFIAMGAHAQTAVNFTVSDCNGQPYDLFTVLDSGKVVVIGWAMPCNTCIPPLKTTYNVVQSYQSSFPGMVDMLLCDDYANSSCATINAWGNANGLANTRRFSNAAINMMDYGSLGMPKVVVVGGPLHKVYYNADDAVNHTALQAAINDALFDITSINSEDAFLSAVVISPNPSADVSKLSFNLKSSSVVVLEVLNELGQNVLLSSYGTLQQGNHILELDVASLSPGLYILKITHNKGFSTHKLLVTK